MGSKRFFAVLTVHCVLAAMTCAGDSQPVALTSLPAAVQRALQPQLAGGKLGEIEKIDADGESLFQVIVIKGDDERTVKIDSDGALLSVEIGLSEAPAAIRGIIQKMIGGGSIDNIDKTFTAGVLSYDVDFTTSEGVERSFTLAADGKLERTQVFIGEVPGPVRKTIEQNSVNATLGEIFKTFTDGAIAYDVDITRAGKERDFIVGADGKLVSKEMFLAELPEGARKTITEKIGAGKILRIDESFEKRGGVFPFEVEGRKEGKPFNFSVGPKGRFFGMD